MAQRISNPAIHHIDKDTGAPLSGGQLFFFEINSTTPKDTFSDEEGTIPNTNPVILDGSGVEPDIFGVGSYRVVLQNSNDVQQWERDPVNFETTGAQFEDWLATVDYAVNDIVEGSDGVFYISIQTPNLNNDPAAGINPAFWSPFALIGGSVNGWLSTFDYALEAIVEGSDGKLYASIQTPNLNNDPTSTATFWTEFDLLKRWNINETYSIGDPVTIDSRTYISKTNSNLGNNPTTDGTNWQGSRTPTIQAFLTGTPTWTKPAGVTYVIVECIGGGGGGASSTTTSNSAGGAGGGGGYGRSVIDVTAITSEIVTIGAGGVGGDPGSGTTGGTTSFGAHISATGGGAGLQFVGGNGGSSTNGDIATTSGDGEDGGSGNALRTTRGGDTVYSYAVPPERGSSVGPDGEFKGAGAGGGFNGASTDRAGGSGRAGYCSVTEYYN